MRIELFHELAKADAALKQAHEVVDHARNKLIYTLLGVAAEMREVQERKLVATTVF
jgi:hypothetical protein